MLYFNTHFLYFNFFLDLKIKQKRKMKTHLSISIHTRISSYYVSISLLMKCNFNFRKDEYLNNNFIYVLIFVYFLIVFCFFCLSGCFPHVPHICLYYYVFFFLNLKTCVFFYLMDSLEIPFVSTYLWNETLLLKSEF